MTLERYGAPQEPHPQARRAVRPVRESGLPGVLAGCTLAILVLAVGGCAPGASGAAGATGAASSGPPPQVQTFQVTDASHVNIPVQYPQDPPVGGPHAPQWQNCGFYDGAIPNELVVHSMEHGAAWIAYRPDLPAAQLDVLRRLARDPAGKGYVLVTAYPALPVDVPVVASAWGRQLRLGRFDEGALRAFIASYANGPQTPEMGAPCSGGVGQPK